MRRSVVDNTRSPGVFVVGANVTLEDVVVKNTRGARGDRRFGRGIVVQDDEGGSRAHLEIRRVILSGNHDAGLFVRG